MPRNLIPFLGIAKHVYLNGNHEHKYRKSIFKDIVLTICTLYVEININIAEKIG